MCRPVLLLPQGMTREMTDAELESVLLHELIHVERHDNLIAALQRALCYVICFGSIRWCGFWIESWFRNRAWRASSFPSLAV